MTGLALDIWQDLREKRLWPVAVGMLAALVAIPVVLFKPASSPPQAPLPHVSGPGGAQLPVSSVTSTLGNGSALEKFVQRDPFRPLASLTTASSGGHSSTGSSGKTAGSGSQVSTTSNGSGSSAGAGGSGSGTPSGASPSTTQSSGTSHSTVTHHFYSWEVDAKFGHPGHEKSYDSLKPLGMLPDTQNPVVTFMGVVQTSKGWQAVFFIPDPDIVAYGKGGCNNGGGACRFVYLDTSSKSSENFATLDGSKKYRLDLVDIKTYVLPNPPKASSSATDNGATAAAQEAIGLSLQSLASFASR